MSAIMSKSGRRIHSRDIVMSTYDAGENAIIVEGELMEKRLQEYYLMSGEKRPSGVLHNMIIRFIAEAPSS